MVYFNTITDEGIKTIDSLDGSDFRTNSELQDEIDRIVLEYEKYGYSVLISSYYYE